MGNRIPTALVAQADTFVALRRDLHRHPELSFKEFELLKYLMENSLRAVSREELISKIWGDDYYGETRTLDIHIGTLRQKLFDTADNSSYIKTVRGVGYRFVGGVGK